MPFLGNSTLGHYDIEVTRYPNFTLPALYYCQADVFLKYAF